MAKKYIVDLSEDEVSQLQSIIKKGKHKARTITRANILLMAAEDETDSAIADRVRAHVATVQRIRDSNSHFEINRVLTPILKFKI